MHWYDAADAKAWPVGLAVFVLAGVVFLIAGLGWWSLLTAFAFGVRSAEPRRCAYSCSATTWRS